MSDSLQNDSFQLQLIELLMRGGLYLPTSTYFLDGPVTPRMAGDFIRAMHVLEQLGEPITIHLSTPGGDVTAGLDIYDAIKAAKVPVTIIGRGEIQSMGTVILQAAKVRLLTPNTLVMMHIGFGNTAVDLPENVIRQAQSVRALTNRCYDLIGSRIGLSRKEMLEKFSYDSYFTAKQAIRLGLADRLTT